MYFYLKESSDYVRKEVTFSKTDQAYPILSVFSGLLFAQRMTTISWIPILATVLYLYTSIWLKNYWLKKTASTAKSNTKCLLSILLILGLLTYFSFSYSLITLPILIILTSLIQMKVHFVFFNLDGLYTVLYSYLLMILLNFLSFYFQLNYLSLEVSLYITLAVTSILILLKLTKRYVTSPEY